MDCKTGIRSRGFRSRRSLKPAADAAGPLRNTLEDGESELLTGAGSSIGIVSEAPYCTVCAGLLPMRATEAWLAGIAAPRVSGTQH